MLLAPTVLLSDRKWQPCGPDRRLSLDVERAWFTRGGRVGTGLHRHEAQREYAARDGMRSMRTVLALVQSLRPSALVYFSGSSAPPQVPPHICISTGCVPGTAGEWESCAGFNWKVTEWSRMNKSPFESRVCATRPGHSEAYPFLYLDLARGVESGSYSRNGRP